MPQISKTCLTEIQWRTMAKIEIQLLEQIFSQKENAYSCDNFNDDEMNKMFFQEYHQKQFLEKMSLVVDSNHEKYYVISFL